MRACLLFMDWGHCVYVEIWRDPFIISWYVLFSRRIQYSEYNFSFAIKQTKNFINTNIHICNTGTMNGERSMLQDRAAERYYISIILMHSHGSWLVALILLSQYVLIFQWIMVKKFIIIVVEFERQTTVSIFWKMFLGFSYVRWSTALVDGEWFGDIFSECNTN